MFKSLGTGSVETGARCMFCLTPSGLVEVEIDDHPFLLCEKCAAKGVIERKDGKEVLRTFKPKKTT